MSSVFEILKNAINACSDREDIPSPYDIKCKPMFEWESYVGDDREMMTGEEQAAAFILIRLYAQNGGHLHRTDMNGEKYAVFDVPKYPKQQILLTLERARHCS